MVLEHVTTGTTGLKLVGFKDDSLLLPMRCCHMQIEALRWALPYICTCICSWFIYRHSQ